jgi:small subunit ribosomal protein S6
VIGPPCPGCTGADLDRREVNRIAITRTYETLYIVDPNLTDEQLQAVISKYRGVITNMGGEVISAERWDKRRLAYEVKDFREGIYVLMYFSGEATVPFELDRVMKLSEDCIRHLITREENGQADMAKERASRPVAQPAPQPEAPAAVVETPAEAPQEEAQPAPEAAEAAPAEEAEAPAEVAEEAAAEAPVEAEAAVETAETTETPEETA